MTRMMRDNRGFSLIELLISLFVMTLVLGASARALMDVVKVDEAIALMADVNHNLQSSSTNMVRDLVDAGRNVDIGGLPLRSGGSSGSVVRPGPSGAATAGWPTATVLYAVTPGNDIGPTIGGQATDVVTIVAADDRLRLLANASVTGISNGATITLAATDTVGTTPFNTVRVGDLFVLTRNGSRAVVYVTAVNADVRVFTVSNGDPANMNRTSATNGGIRQIVANGATQQAAVKRIKMTTYWTEVAADNVPYLDAPGKLRHGGAGGTRRHEPAVVVRRLGQRRHDARRHAVPHVQPESVRQGLPHALGALGQEVQADQGLFAQ